MGILGDIFRLLLVRRRQTVPRVRDEKLEKYVTIENCFEKQFAKKVGGYFFCRSKSFLNRMLVLG